MTPTQTPGGTTLTATATRTRTVTPALTPSGATATATLTPAGTTLVATYTPTPFATPGSQLPPAPVTIRQNIVRPASNQPVHIAVRLDHPQRVVIKIYSRRGQLIKTLADQVMNAGTFEAVWEGVNQKGRVVGSGVYIVHIQTDSFSEKRKLVVVH